MALERWTEAEIEGLARMVPTGAEVDHAQRVAAADSPTLAELLIAPDYPSQESEEK